MFDWIKKTFNDSIDIVDNSIKIGDKVYVAIHYPTNWLENGVVLEIKRHLDPMFTQYVIKIDEGEIFRATGYDVIKDNSQEVVHETIIKEAH